jgi:BirA family transcriptional regulator, biotin operon repressor / biotin---[acetyl-CoA-carboxylase] ligase
VESTRGRGAVSFRDPRLAPTRFSDVQWFASIDSTNRYLIDMAARGAAEGLVAVADEQTAGRGRLGRTWVAPAGTALLVSVLLRPRVAPERLHLLTLACALAAIDAVRVLAGIDARVKWPNDVVVDDRKLAGILAEKHDDSVVVGMGLNVSFEDFPEELAATATACSLHGDRPVDRAELLVAWLRALDARLDAPDAITDDAVASSATLGRRVRVELPDAAFDADAITLSPEGHLIVRRADGLTETIAAADVVHLGPA